MSADLPTDEELIEVKVLPDNIRMLTAEFMLKRFKAEDATPEEKLLITKELRRRMRRLNKHKKRIKDMVLNPLTKKYEPKPKQGPRHTKPKR